MAIGDAIAVIMGTAQTDRQPATGVEEKITSISKGGTTDELQFYDGNATVGFMVAALVTTTNPVGWENCAIMLTNEMRLRKTGTTDRIFICGVQTNA
jgi:hypothetical protein